MSIKSRIKRLEQIKRNDCPILLFFENGVYTNGEVEMDEVQYQKWLKSIPKETTVLVIEEDYGED